MDINSIPFFFVCFKTCGILLLGDKMQKVITALVVIHYNDYPSTRDLLRNVSDYKSIDYVLVVDNCSSDNSYKKLLKFSNEKTEILRTDSNRGYSAAINFGSKYLIDKFSSVNLIISNSDIIINKDDDIKRLSMVLGKYDDYAVIAPVVLENKTLNRGWRVPSPLVEVGLNIPYFHRKIRKRLVHYKDEHFNSEFSVVEAVSGCFFMIKSGVLEDIDFLDENVFLYYEENILAKKIEKIGKKIVIDNGVLVVHNHSVSIDKNMKKIKKYKALKRSQYYFQTEYNSANVFEKVLLKVSAFLSIILYSIYYYFSDLYKKIFSK